MLLTGFRPTSVRFTAYTKPPEFQLIAGNPDQKSLIPDFCPDFTDFDLNLSGSTSHNCIYTHMYMYISAKDYSLLTRMVCGVGVAVVHVRDLGTGLDTAQPSQRATLPWSHGDKFVSFTLEGGGSLTLRASGTEPKLKYYLEVQREQETVSCSLADELAVAIIDEVLQPSKFGFLRSH